MGVSCREPSSLSSRFRQQQPINLSTSDEINEVAIPASLCALSHQPAVMWGGKTTLTAPDFQQTRDYHHVKPVRLFSNFSTAFGCLLHTHAHTQSHALAQARSQKPGSIDKKGITVLRRQHESALVPVYTAIEVRCRKFFILYAVRVKLGLHTE